MADDLSGSVLAPIETQEFFAEYWEKKPMHISRSDADHFASILSVASIEQVLSTNELRFPSVQLTQSNNPIAVADYTDDNLGIIPLQLIRLHQSGATVVMSQAHKLIPELGSLTRHVESKFQLRCQTNVYLSPPGHQGFNAHFDSHDVFILQVSGRKTFNFYTGGVELPFSYHAYDAETDKGGSLEEQIELNPGDTLYIPRGFMHDAVAHDNESSLHITLGVYPVTLSDLFKELVEVAAETEHGFRQSIPANVWLNAEHDNTLFENQVSSLLEKTFSSENLHRSLSRLKERLSLDTSPDCVGLLGRAGQVGSIQLDDVVSIREHSLMSIDKGDSSLQLRAFGQLLEFAEPMSSALAWLLEQKQAKVSALIGLEDDQKIALCQRLYLENIIEIVEL